VGGGNLKGAELLVQERCAHYKELRESVGLLCSRAAHTRVGDCGLGGGGSGNSLTCSR